MSQLVLLEGKHTVQTAHCALWLSCGMRFVRGSSLKISPPADQEKHDADPDVGEHDTHPDLHGQRVHEGENTGAHLWTNIDVNIDGKKSYLHRLLDHDRDAKRHKRFGEVCHLAEKFSNGIHIYLS